MKKLILLMPLLLAGCATNYDAYVEANIKVAEAKARADTEKYKAMAAIASTGDAAAKVAAVMSMALGQPNQQNQQQITPPRSPADTTLQAIAAILPSIAQIYGINRQVALGMEQVRGNVAIQQSVSTAGVANTASTNNTFLGIASKIQAPAANITTTTTTDNTHTPTVIKVEPLIVNPTVVNPTVVKPEVVNPVIVNPTTTPK